MSLGDWPDNPRAPCCKWFTGAPSQEHVLAALRSAVRKGVELKDSRVVVDIGASKGFAHYAVDAFPTITSTRATMRSWWIADLGRRPTLAELAMLQGFEIKDIDYKAAKVSEKRLLHMIGNAMSCNVLERLVPCALDSVGIVPSNPNLDRWQFAVRQSQPAVTPTRGLKRLAS